MMSPGAKRRGSAAATTNQATRRGGAVLNGVNPASVDSCAWRVMLGPLLAVAPASDGLRPKRSARD
jgi:hypothetical protein